MPTRVPSLGRAPRIGPALRAALDAYAAACRGGVHGEPTPDEAAARTALERRILDYARRRRYDGEVLTPPRAHQNQRGRK